MKIVAPEKMPAVCDEIRAAGGTTVFTHGVCDLLVPGQLDRLVQAGGRGTHLIVALHTDASAQKVYGDKRPLLSLQERAEVLAAMEVVSFVTWFAEETPNKLMASLNPDIVIDGIEDPAAFADLVKRIIELPGIPS